MSGIKLAFLEECPESLDHWIKGEDHSRTFAFHCCVGFDSVLWIKLLRGDRIMPSFYNFGGIGSKHGSELTPELSSELLKPRQF